MDGWGDVTFAEAICLMRLDGQITWVNDLFTDLLGYSLEEMLARPRFSLMDPDDAAAIRDSLPAAFASGRGTTPLRIKLTTKAGDEVTAAAILRPHLADDEDPMLVISLRPQEDHWEAVLTALAGDSEIDSTLQALADALGHHGEAVVLSVAADDGGRLQLASSLVPPELMGAVARLDELLDARSRSADGTVIAWDEVPALSDGDREALAAHRSGVAVVTTIDDPSGLGDARFLFLFESATATLRMRWMTAHRPKEYFSLALLARHRRRELVHAATHDPLTGLPNRARFFGRITELGGEPVGLLFIDLDEFKPVNDALGHAAGDLVLIEVARRLRWCIRPDDLVARVGGDEFGVVCADLSDVEVLTEIADRLVREIAEPIEVGGARVQIGASVGVALGHHITGTDLVDAADAAMYDAKHNGKSRWSMAPL